MALMRCFSSRRLSAPQIIPVTSPSLVVIPTPLTQASRETPALLHPESPPCVATARRQNSARRAVASRRARPPIRRRQSAATHGYTRRSALAGSLRPLFSRPRQVARYPLETLRPLRLLRQPLQLRITHLL